MLNHRVRNLAVTGITITSAALLTALATTGASATTAVAAGPGHAALAVGAVVPEAPAAANAPDTTGARCAGDGNVFPWACVQVFGSGLIVDAWNGWAAATDGVYDGNSLHMELYYNAHSPAYPDQSIPELNCGGFSLTFPGERSSNCGWPGASPNKTVNPGYYCAAVWQSFNGSFYDLDHVCVYVHA